MPPADQQQPCRRHARWGTQLEESRWLHTSFATPVAVRNRCSKEGAALEHSRTAGPMKVRLRTRLVHRRPTAGMCATPQVEDHACDGVRADASASEVYCATRITPGSRRLGIGNRAIKKRCVTPPVCAGGLTPRPARNHLGPIGAPGRKRFGHIGSIAGATVGVEDDFPLL